jgi:ATP-dependent Clp protease protease subunit
VSLALRKEKKKKNKERGCDLNTFILETTEHGDMPVDIYQKLANDRILFITDHVNDKVATDIIATLLLKDSENSEEKISLFINSSGGDIRSVFMIYDIMQMIQAPIETVCIGSAMNESVILLAAGEPGMRLATKNSIFSVSQLEHDWMSRANLSDAKKIVTRYARDNRNMMEIIASTTGKPIKQVLSDFERRVFMNATQASKYGLVDKIIAFSRNR